MVMKQCRTLWWFLTFYINVLLQYTLYHHVIFFVFEIYVHTVLYLTGQQWDIYFTASLNHYKWSSLWSHSTSWHIHITPFSIRQTHSSNIHSWSETWMQHWASNADWATRLPSWPHYAIAVFRLTGCKHANKTYKSTLCKNLRINKQFTVCRSDMMPIM